ncbi:MAG: PAS domain-containing sensor histidine kinase [Prolixibacteraceae bacterium]|nr:PAS domain-containing sensor histidine kinase [Prolixibacteraceae bacterium]
MNIDIYTFGIVLGIFYAIQFVIFLIEFYYNRSYKGIGWWLIYAATSLFGFLCLIARQIKSIEHLAIFGQNVAFITASFLLYIGLMRFLGKREKMNLIIIIFIFFLIPFTYFLFLKDNIQVRTIVIWSAVTLIAVLSAYDLQKYKTKSLEIACNISITVFAFHALFSGSKVLLLLSGNVIKTFDSQVFINSSSYIELLIVSLLWTYTLILFINHRLTSDMKLAKDHFEVIFNTTPDTILITGLADGLITSVNDKFEEVTGYSAEEALGKTVFDLNLWEEPEERKVFAKLVQKNGYCSDFEYKCRIRNQNILTGLISSRTIILNNEPYIISVVRDITERKKREEEIVLQNAQLQILNNEKDKFFSIIAHDLKNPFNAFLGLTEVMADEIPNLPLSEVILLAGKMRDSARNLNGLLENLLSWSMIKRGMTSFHPEIIALLPEINESILTYHDPANKKQIGIGLQVTSEMMVYADKNMLRSMIRNLVSNAIKFTPEGGSVIISASVLPDNSTQISIKDTGIGITQEMQKLLFQLDSTTSRSGTNGELSCGLGLHLCQEYVSTHNGKIWVESLNGEGSTFFVTLPSVEQV